MSSGTKTLKEQQKELVKEVKDGNQQQVPTYAQAPGKPSIGREAGKSFEAKQEERHVLIVH